ncbi:MAG TPA: hypothetical protein VFF52_04365 [Isosphaeraceae bacterium]|nr:hypothetical protein [Isosphaeraceae bacterium]
MRNARRLWPWVLVLGGCSALVPGLRSHGQERPPAFEQIIGRPRGVPQLSPQGEWVEIINATPRWVVIQTQAGQQFPIATSDLGDFLVRWPSSLDALGNQSVVEAMGADRASNIVQTSHIDVFEGGDQALVGPTYYNSLLPTPYQIINAWDFYGQFALYGQAYPTSPSMLGAPVGLHVVGPVLNRVPLQVSLPGNNIATVVPPAGTELIVTRVTRGAVTYIRKGDYAFLIPREITPKGLILSEFVLYKTIPFPLFNPLR